MKVRYFKKRALAKVAVGVIDNYVQRTVNDSFAMVHSINAALFTPTLAELFNNAAGIHTAWREMFNVHRKNDKAFVGTFETEAEAIAVIEKAKAQKKAALYIA